VGEAETVEVEVVGGGVESACDGEEDFEDGEFYVERVWVRVSLGAEVELAGGGVDGPLAGGADEAGGVGEEEVGGHGVVGLFDGVIAPEIVVPSRLAHEDFSRGDAFDGGDALGEEAGGAELEACVLGELGEGWGGGFGGEAGAGEGVVLAVELDLGDGGEMVGDPKLAGVKTDGGVGDPEVEFGVGEAPLGDGDGSGEDGMGFGCGLPSDGMTVLAAVGGGEAKGGGDAVGAVGKLHGDVVGGVVLADGALGALEGLEGMRGSAFGNVAAGGGDGYDEGLLRLGGGVGREGQDEEEGCQEGLEGHGVGLTDRALPVYRMEVVVWEFAERKRMWKVRSAMSSGKEPSRGEKVRVRLASLQRRWIWAWAAMAKDRDELEHGEVDDEDAELGAEHAKAGEGEAFVRVWRESGEDGSDGGVDAGVKDAAENVGGCGVEDLGVRAEVGGEKRECAEEREGNAEPKEPGAALAPAAVGFVEDKAPDRRVQGVGAAGEEQNGTSRAGGDAEDIGIKLEEIKRDDTEDELAADFAGGIAEAACEQGVDGRRR
jgi:hypothetical protein